jgi:hypothetical protein
VARVAGVPRVPGAPSFGRWDGLALVTGLRQGADAVPGGHDVSGPGPGDLDLQAGLAAAAGQAGGGVQKAAQGLRLGLGEAASRASSLSQASRVAAVKAAACQALFMASEVDVISSPRVPVRDVHDLG